jgi:hypothetical protein
MALAYTVGLREDQLDQITAAIGTSGLVRIYDDSAARPAGPGTAVPGGSVLLAELPLSSTAAAAAGTPTPGVLTFNSITDEDSAPGDGDALWFRVTTSGGTGVIDGDVGTAASDLNLNSVSITSGGTVSITSFEITAGNA